MRPFTRLFLGAAGVAAIAGTAMAADRVHVLDVTLPDGAVGHVRYTGDVVPRIVLVPVAAVSPVDAVFGGGSPFAMLDRMTAMMDAQAGAMMRQAALLSQAAPAGGAAPAGLPAGITRYSYTSYSSTGTGGCTRSVQMTSFAPGQAPQVVRRTSGDCTAVTNARPTPAAAPTARAAPPATPFIPARYVAPAAKPKPGPAI